MEVETAVTRHLKNKNINFRLFSHPRPILTLEQAAQERGQILEQVIRSILFRSGKEDFIMVLVGGKNQVSWPKLRKYLGKSRIALATNEEVRQVTGYEIGAVAPFGTQKPIRVLIDEKVFQQVDISIGSGERGTTVIMASEDLLRALDACEVVQISNG